jgi:type I restriction enzyme S subunit
MKLETFFKHFDLLAEAPNGVQKLRELILDLAVRGKLVPQDANDEPAAVLLERIKKEKERLVKEGKIKKSKPLPEITPDEIPYNLPENWEWVRLGDIIEFFNGYAFKSNEYQLSGVGIIRIGDIQKGEIVTDNLKFVDMSYLVSIDKNLQVNPNELLIAMSGATTGKLGFNKTTQTFLLNQRVGKLIFYLLDSNFSYFYLTTKIQENLIKSVGSAIPNLSTEQIKNLEFPLPPLAEQKRIVTKVDELMKLCDELEARQKKKQETRILINNAALNKLLTADTPETFTKNWQRIGDNFDILYSAPENIGKLRQAILQLAVMGKLVPQNANDEPAAVLLERIKKEKERKVKKEKSLPAIKDDEIPFDLPIGWECVRLGEICSFFGGYAFKSDSYVELSSNQVIRLGNVKNDKIMLKQSPVYITDEIAFENEKFLIHKEDILITMTGTKNKRDYCFTSVVEDKHIADKNLYLNQRVGSLRISETLFIQLVNIFLKSSMILDLLFSSETGTANQGNIGVDAIRNLPFPLPPLNEQKRIVTKVDKLMKLCDELETKLTQTQTEREKIINAAVKQLLTV